MELQAVLHNTFVIESSYPASPERVFDALADPGKKQRWFGGGEHHDVEEFRMDFRVGGQELLRSRFNATSPFPGVELVNQGSYLEIIANRRVVLASTMSLGGRCISASLLTFELRPAERGTHLIFTDQSAFFEGADGPQLREAGWRKLLGQLAVEAPE